MGKSTNVLWHQALVSRSKREKLNSHKSVLLWFTGLSGSGKSSLAHAVEERLHVLGRRTFVLDGDNVRHGLCSDLGFSVEARVENIRRIGETAKLFLEAGVITLAAVISPFRADRERVRALLACGDYIEIFCDCPLYVCEERDVKGLYEKARSGEVEDFTGISSSYEIPETPDLIVETHVFSLDECVEKVLCILRARGIIDSIDAIAME